MSSTGDTICFAAEVLDIFQEVVGRKEIKMRLCSYVVTVDRGLAPNPFWGYCTLAVCTPNHMGVRAQKGDWFIGTTPIARGSKLVYAMKVSEVLSFDEYFNDPRFEKKKPNIQGTWRQRCGDNMYYIDESTAKRVVDPVQNDNSLIQSSHVQKKHQTPTTRTDKRRQRTARKTAQTPGEFLGRAILPGILLPD